ncbi:MAG: FIST signal transduction protein [Betaproteobacteria bacterium]
MFQAASASSSQPTAREAAEECVVQIAGKGIGAPAFALVHANSALPLQDIGRILRAHWPGARLHAATSCLGGMTDSGGATSDSLSLAILAINDATGEYGVAAGDFHGGARATGYRLARQALENAGRAGEIPAVVLVCATPGDEEDFLAGVQEVVGSGAPIIGGSAADNDITGSWRILLDEGSSGSGAIVSTLFPSVAVTAAFQSGYAPTEQRGVVTRAAGRRVFEIDHKPAANQYERWTEGAVRRPVEGAANILMASALAPLGRAAGLLGDMPLYSLSHPETICADGSITLFTHIAEGDELVLMKATAATLVSRASGVVRSARRIGDLHLEDVSAMIMYYCGGCMLQVSDRLDEIRGSLMAELPRVPFVVGFTFGEQGSLSPGPVRHGNLMISAIVFGS